MISRMGISISLRNTRGGRVLWALLVVSWLWSPWSVGAGPTRSLQAGETETPPKRPPVQVQVDPRVELLSIIFCLSGDPMYNMGQVESYSNDVQRHFGPFRNLPVVRLARELRNTGGMGVDGPMSMAVHVKDASALEELGEYNKAIGEYGKAIALDKDYAMAYFNRGVVFMQQGKTADATTDFEKVIEIGDNPDLTRMAQARLDALKE